MLTFCYNQGKHTTIILIGIQQNTPRFLEITRNFLVVHRDVLVIFGNLRVLCVLSHNKLRWRLSDLLALAFGFNKDFLLKSETPEDDEGEDGIGVGLEEFREEIHDDPLIVFSKD